MGATFETLAADILFIDAETARISEREGFEHSCTCTGKVFVDSVNEAVWYEMADEYNTTTWVSRDYPDRAAWDETIVVVDGIEDCANFANWDKE